MIKVYPKMIVFCPKTTTVVGFERCSKCPFFGGFTQKEKEKPFYVECKYDEVDSGVGEIKGK